MTLQHAGSVCPRCNGNVMLKIGELTCLQCGAISAYIDQPRPDSGLPYAAPPQNPKTKPPPSPLGAGARMR